MHTERLSPPFDAGVLNTFAADVLHEHACDITDTTRWLLKHNSERGVVEGIRSAWLRTELPLREWAEIIDGVEIEARHDGLDLVVSLMGTARTVVRQAAPFTPARLRQIAESFPAPIPKPMVELALAAPGLSLQPSGSLAEPAFFANRLGYVMSWMRNRRASDVERHGWEYPDPGVQLMEVLSNGIGDCYAVNCDGSIVFLDHEARGLVRCNVTLTQLRDAYFASPESIMDPYDRGWGVLPQPPEPIDRQLAPQILLAKRSRDLTHSGVLALAIRGCRRAMAAQHLQIIPRKWERHDQELARILDHCQDIVIRGAPLTSDLAQEFRATSEGAMKVSRAIEKETGKKYSPFLLTFAAIPALIQACAQSGDNESIRQAAASAITVRAYGEDVSRESSLAALRDLDYLLDQKPGLAGTVGKPVPSTFFDRPIWPADLAPPKR